MYVLYETAAGYALFKLLDDNKLEDAEAIWDEFKTAEKAEENLQLVSFKSFKSTADALSNIADVTDAKVPKTLKKLLKSKATDGEELAVGDAKLASSIKEMLSIKCVNNTSTNELFRVIRTHHDSLLADYKPELDAMRLALSHSLGRYRVKFNPEKLDTMIVQAVSLIDDVDKELNNYSMRLREWYGWHFPELGKIIPDHGIYARTVRAIGNKQNAATVDLSTILTEELAEKVKEEAEISMGTDISEIDVLLIGQLCDQVVEMYDYRTQLAEYLKNRMSALAPNLTVLLGELIGARLIARAGSLINLAKYPASTVQILGAEKALFRALKTKSATPKYGIIYHAQLVAQADAKIKGKMARKLAAKVSLSTRIDAMRDESIGNDVGIEARANLERALKIAEKPKSHVGGFKKGKKDFKVKSEVLSYDDSEDVKVVKKRKTDGEETNGKPAKKLKVEHHDDEEENQNGAEDEEMEEVVEKKPKKSKSKKAVKQESDDDDEE